MYIIAEYGVFVKALYCVLSVLHFSKQSYSVLEPCLVCSSHLSGGGIAYAIEDFVEYINLLLVQRILERNAELVKLVRKLSGVNIPLSIVVKHINHRYMSFQIQYYRKRLH